MMTAFQPTADRGITDALKRSVRDHWGLFLAEGIILTLLGIAAIIIPIVAGLAATIFLGWLFLIAGIVGLIASFRAKQAPGFWWSLLSAAVAVLAGGVLLANPLAGLVTLTYVMIAFFVIDGGLMIALALVHRTELSGKWEWILINGLIDLLLAGILVSGLPGTIAWALGLLLGIDLLMGGATLIAMALDARKALTS